MSANDRSIATALDRGRHALDGLRLLTIEIVAHDTQVCASSVASVTQAGMADRTEFHC